MERTGNAKLQTLPWIVLLLIALASLPAPVQDRAFAAESQPTVAAPPTAPLQSRTEAQHVQEGPAPVPVIPQKFDLVAMRGDEPHDLVISADGRRAYAPLRNTDNLLVIDVPTNQVIDIVDLYPEAEHPLGPAPQRVALTPDGSRLLILNSNDESVTLFDTTTLSTIKTLRFNHWLGGVAVAPDGSMGYVSLNKDDVLIKVIDIASAEVLTSISQVPHIGSPGPIAFAPDGEQAYVALSTMSTGSLLILDPATHTVSDTIPIPGGGNIGDDLVVSQDGTAAYISERNAGKVFAIDLVNHTVPRTWDIVQAEGLALNAGGSRLYVGTFGWTGESNYNLWMYDTETGSFLKGVNFVHPAPYGRVSADIQGLGLTPDGSRLYASSVDADGVFVVDPETLEPQGMIPTQAIASFLPLRAVLSPDGATLYVAGGSEEPVTISVIDTANLKVAYELRDDRIGACQGDCSGLALSPDGSALYVVSSNCNELLVFDTASRTLLAAPDVGTLGAPLTHVAVSPVGNPVYVLDSVGDVHLVDPTGLAMTEILTTGVESAWTLKLAPGGARGYIAGGYGYAVLDLTTPAVVKQEDYECGEIESFCYMHGRPLGITPDGAQYLVGEFYSLHIYDAETDTQSTLIDLGDWNPHRTLIRDLAFSPDGSRGYAAMWDEKAVIAFDTDTWTVTAKIDTGREPYFGSCPAWLAVSPDGTRLYAAAEESDNVVIIDTTTDTVVGTVRVGHPYPIFLPVTLKDAVPPTIIAGTVTNAAGTPLADVHVSAGAYDDIINCGSEIFNTTTAADGTYRLNVSPGSYLVYINSHNQPGSYIPEAYPNINSWSEIDAATSIQVGVGDRVDAVDLSLPVGFTVSGRLVNDAGQPVLGAGGNIRDDTQGLSYGCALGFGSSNADGTFRVNVPAGTYDLNFCTASTCHTVIRNRSISAHLDLGNVRFAEAP